ncbi:MAG: M28 family peptidase, partial [Candidatus Eiseniibacteriota bacterium]
MGRSLARAFRWGLLGLAVVWLVVSSVSTHAGQAETLLLKVRWQERFELSCLESGGFTPRYCQDDLVILQVPSWQLDEVGSCTSGFTVLDTVAAGERCWLVHPAEAPSRDSLSLYAKLHPLDENGLLLLRVEEGLEARLAPWVTAMMPLPERASCSALLPPAGPPAAVAARVREPLSQGRARFLASVYSQVSLDSVAAIIHFLSVDDSSGELRTRFTFRDETFQMAELLRQRLAGAMGGRGEDSLHAFTFWFGGADYDKYNIIGRLPGRVPGSGLFVMCAHYDSYAGRTAYEDPERRWNWRTDPAPGADDNASGVASILECARVLSALDFDFDIEFVLFTAEEQGLFGSTAYSEEHQAAGT